MGTNWRDTRDTSRTSRNQVKSDRAFLRLTRRRRIVVLGAVVLMGVMIIAVIAL